MVSLDFVGTLWALHWLLLGEEKIYLKKKVTVCSVHVCRVHILKREDKRRQILPVTTGYCVNPMAWGKKR